VPFQNEKRILRKDGEYRWFLAHYNPLLDEQRRVIRWYSTGIDFDDRVRGWRTPCASTVRSAEDLVWLWRPIHDSGLLHCPKRP